MHFEPMKKVKKNKNVGLDDTTIDAEIAQIFREMEEMEYRDVLYEQEMAVAKSAYWDLIIRLERSVFTEEERKELEAHAEQVRTKIEEMDAKLKNMQARGAKNRARLEKICSVRDAAKERKRTKVKSKIKKL